jgi:hypothetical protein
MSLRLVLFTLLSLCLYYLLALHTYRFTISFFERVGVRRRLVLLLLLAWCQL